MKDRRRFMHSLAAGLAGLGGAARAQPVGRVYRLGLLRPTAPIASEFMATGIPNALRQQGWVEGQNLQIDVRYAEGRMERLPVLARELVALRCDAVVAVGIGAVRAMREASDTVPIVMFGNFDPVAAGLVSSLARPGGNVTGVLIAAEGTLAGKKLEYLRDAAPQVRRTALLVPDDPNLGLQVAETQKAAAALGTDLRVVPLRGNDYDAAFATMRAERCGALFVAATTFFVRDRRQIIDLALRHKLPSMWEWPEQVADGGLMAYGTSLAALYQRIAFYVERIFKGAAPGQLPVEQPTTYELVINLKTARSLGLSLPQALLLRTDRLIE
jgi:putative tryptophan/tyrosine transport system substrate-binding protein